MSTVLGDRLWASFSFAKWFFGCGSRNPKVVLLQSRARSLAAAAAAADEIEERYVVEEDAERLLLLFRSKPWESDSEEALSRISSSILLKDAT